jgi:hypothetical protein
VEVGEIVRSEGRHGRAMVPARVARRGRRADRTSGRGVLATSSEVAAISDLTSAAPLAAVIFVVTVGAVISRPRGLMEAWAALLGAVVMVLAGLVGRSTLPRT